MDVDILRIAETWSYWDGKIPDSTPRHVALPDQLRDSLCLAIQGVRRCGKSTLLRQLIQHYGLPPAQCMFVNFEDPRLSRVLSFEVLDTLVTTFRARHPEPQDLYFFLDEVQGVEGWQRWLRSQLERPSGNHFVVTGSNATLLSGELSSALTGRHLTIELFPFDLEELREVDPYVTLEKYLNLGGFPEPFDMSDGDRLRRQYFNDIVERDIRERVGARSSTPIRQMTQMVYESAGSEMSLRRAAGAIGVAVETAKSYLEACQQAYMLFECPWFAWSERKRAHRNSKYYPVDTGLRRVVSTRTGEDLGKSLECAVFLALKRRYKEVFYWRDRGEVDFVVRLDDRLIPFQVSWDGAQERHQRALEEFYERYPRADEAIFVNADNFEGTVDL